jgi:hypothetical protein
LASALVGIRFVMILFSDSQYQKLEKETQRNERRFAEDVRRDVVKFETLTQGLMRAFSKLLAGCHHWAGENDELSAMHVCKPMLASSNEDMSGYKRNITKGNGSEFMLQSDGKGDGSVVLSLGSVEEEILHVKTGATLSQSCFDLLANFI